jgi:hypothetical protein
VARFRIWLTIAFALSAMLGTFLRAQATDEDARKQRFLEASADKSPTPKAKRAKSKSSPSPTPKAKAKAKPKPTETPEPADSPAAKPAKKKVLESDESSPKPKESASPKSKKSTSSTTSKTAKKKSTARKGPASKKKKTAKSGSTGTRKKKSQPEETSKAEKTASSTAAPVARPTAPLPRAISVPTPVTTVVPIEREPTQLTIEKSGYEKPRGFFSRLFGGGGRSSTGGSYRYLTNSVRAEIDRAPVMQRRWQYIVVHNSGTRQGNAAAFDYYHRHVRRMQNGLAYHFVIGNGTSTSNGEVEVGNRWRRQINGGHVHSDYLNNIALGICLVGDFNRDQPTRAQLECCEELIRYLRQRCGKIGNHYAVVRPHREVNPPRWATDCPGDAFPYAWFRRFQD